MGTSPTANDQKVPTGPVVVGIDLSEASDAAIAQARTLAVALDEQLVVVVNINIPERAYVEDFAEVEEREFDDAGHELLRRMAALHAPGVTIESVLTYRDSPADGLLDVVASHGASLLVVASHGRGGMQRWLLGSVAEKLARASSVPVVIVPVGARSAG